MHPALHDWREEFHATLLRLLAYVCGLAVLSIAAAQIFRPAPVLQQVADIKPRAVDWIDVERPYPAFELTIPEAADAPASYAIQRHATGGGRKDILSLGDANGIAPYLRIEVYRPGTEIEAFDDAANEIAARTRGLRLENVKADATPLGSKFGPLTVVPFATRGIMRSCLGFVRSYEDPRLEIVGWFCQGGNEAVERSTLACALDRFTLVAAGSDPKVGALFARAELSRNFCGQRDPILAATPKYKALWDAISHRSAAAPKGRGIHAYARD